MKNYEKPRMNIFALCGTDALCACTYDVVGSNADASMKANIIQMLRILGYDFEGEEIPSNYFGLNENCGVKVDISGYCKFGPSGEMIFNS